MHHLASGTTNRTLLAAAMGMFVLVTVSRVLTPELAQVVNLMIVLIGAVRFHRLQRQRGVFLSRFISPNVARQIICGDLDEVMADSDREISIVCADIRNFTPFSANTETATVMKFLREYYDAVGAAVTAHGGTVKDYAGDGIVVLVGAPQPVADHADRAVKMALAICEAGLEVTSNWSRESLPLSIGIGVATGPVTVGMLGGKERLEYAAVGPAVNLASRLCGSASMGEILVDSRTRELARQQQSAQALQAGKTRQLTIKGFDTPVESFSV